MPFIGTKRRPPARSGQSGRSATAVAKNMRPSLPLTLPVAALQDS